MTDTPAPAPRRPALAALPELPVRTGLYGAVRHVEVGGSVCFGIVITTITASQPFLER